MLGDYYEKCKMRFSVGNYTTYLQALELGIIMGCIISAIVFAAVDNMLVKSRENKLRGAISATVTGQPPSKAFIDDMPLRQSSRGVACSRT